MKAISIMLTLVFAATASFFTPTIIERYTKPDKYHHIKLECPPRGKVISTDPPANQ